MKIALVNRTVSLSHGGLERFTVNLAGALHRDGHAVHVFAERAADLPAGVAFHRVTPRDFFGRTLAFAHGVHRQLAGEDFDIVYGLTRMFRPDAYRMGDGVQRHWMRIRYPFAPWRWLNYLVNPGHAAHLILERHIYLTSGCRRIITNSRLCSDHVQRYYGVPAEKVRVVYNGVDHTLFNPRTARAGRDRFRAAFGVRDSEVLLLHVSNNWSRKGLASTIEAIAALGERGRHCRLLVVGRGRPEPFRRLAQHRGIGDRVIFHAPTAEIGEFYGAADLFVLPTFYDPFSNVCLEAMACGLPVITTSENGAAELIVVGENGFVQEDARSAGELARLLEVCLDPGDLRRMGEAAWSASIPFTLERNLAETLAVFREVIDEGRDGRQGRD